MKKKSLFKAGGPSGVGRYGLAPGLILGLLMVAITCGAQRGSASAGTQSGHVAVAEFDTVKKTGFYRIVLPPELVVHCRADLADLRIRRRDGVFIPYVLKTYADSPSNRGYLPLPDPVIRQKDSSNKHSYVSLSYDEAYRIGRLSLVIRNPILYKRNAEVTSSGEYICTISIDPNDTVFRIPDVKTRWLLIDISNADNAPLVVTRVVTAQSGLYILTHLEQGDVYEFVAGDSLAQKPDYDLHYFTDSLRQRPLNLGLKPVDVRVRGAGNVPRDSTVVRGAVSASENTRSTVILWLALVIVLLLLIYISVKMVKAIAKKETNDRL